MRESAMGAWRENPKMSEIEYALRYDLEKAERELENAKRENRYLRRILKAWYKLIGPYRGQYQWPYRMTEAYLRKEKK